MEKTILGRTGLEVSTAGLGCGGHSQLGMFTRGIDNACDVLRTAYDSGVTFFDTAYAYGTQPAVGKAFAGVSRGSYVLSTKFPYTEAGGIKPAGALERNVDECLKELRTDYIDIYHIHGVRPEDYATVCDRFYPELLRAKEKGKIRFTGLTELFGTDTTHQMAKLAVPSGLWDVIMVGYNLLNPSAAKTVLPQAMEKNLGVLCMFAVRSSLSNPEKLKLDVRKMLAAGQADPALVKEDGTIDFLLEEGYAGTIMEAAYRFCRHTPGIGVTLTGTGDVGHLRDNLKSLSMPPLPRPALERLEKMFGNVDCVSGQQSSPGA